MPYTIPFDVPDLGYEQALSRLREALRLGIEPLLETVIDMLAELGRPDLAFRSLQVAGTNGKTSTSRYAAAILAGEGLRCALYTSPELVRYPERIEVDGSPVEDARFAHGVSAASTAGERVNERRASRGLRPYDVTEFDLLTVAACVIFAEAGVDVAVLEVGLGGRWDATSAVGSIESVAVTGIGYDHMRVLGDTLEAIAAEKAAVIRRGRGCVLGADTAMPPGVEDVFLARAADEGVIPVLLRPEDPRDAPGERGAGERPRTHPGLPRASYRVTCRPRRLGEALELDVETPRAAYGGLCVHRPAYQAANVSCAVVLAERFLGRALDRERLAGSVLACPTPGRFDVLRAEPLALVDACHNPQGVRAFLSAVEELAPERDGRPTLLAAVLEDKDVGGIVGPLARAFPRVVATATPSARALEACRLADAFRAAGARDVRVAPDVAAALELLADEPFVACGSITLAGALAGVLRG